MDAVYRLMLAFFPGLATAPEWVLIGIAALVPTAAFLTFVALCPLGYVYVETKIAGFMQDRIGPKRVGPHGLLQTVADTIKLLFKEAIFPAGVDKVLFVLAPCIVCLGAFMPFAVLPLGTQAQTADLNVGVFYVIAISSLATVGIVLAGWASNNKYALFGGMRSAAQIVSYEIPAVMTLLVIVMMVGSLSFQAITWAQQGGLQNWFLWRYFPLNVVAFLVFFTAALAECNRTPFDIPEAESELVAGFHTEYSGFFFALFFLAEYTEMLVVSVTMSVLFLGGYFAPHPMLQVIRLGDVVIGLGPAWMLVKAWGLVFVMMWLRWTLPRLRVDQLMYVAWKVLLPVSMGLVVVIGGLTLWLPNGFMWDRWVGWPIVAGLLAFLVVVAARARVWHLKRLKELAA